MVRTPTDSVGWRATGETRSDGDEDLIEERLAACLEASPREAGVLLEALCREFPERAEGLRRAVACVRGFETLPSVAPGDAILPDRVGEFELIEPLGAGGMGVVWRGRQPSLDREVAVKILRPDHLPFDRAHQRFRREVEAVSRLHHPSIVPVHAFGEDGGLPWFAMELVRGITFEDILDRCRGRDPTELSGRVVAEGLAAVGAGALSLEEDWVRTCARVALHVAQALAHAHASGVLHRDVKPSNVMIDGDGRIVILDFGLARLSGDSNLTRTRAQPGSLPYMAPEQLRGDRDRNEVDERADIHALGVTLYELLTLRLPYEGDTAEETARRILHGDPQRPRRVNPLIPKALEAICLRAMAPERSHRHADARALAQDLRRFLDGEAVSTWYAPFSWRVRRLLRRRPLTIATTMSVVALAVAYALFGGRGGLTDEEARRAVDVAREEERRIRDLIGDYIVEDVLLASPYRGAEEAASARRRVAAAVERMDRFEGPDDLKARLLISIGNVQVDLGMLDEAARRFESARLLAARVPGGEPLTGAAMAGLAQVRVMQGRLDDAERLCRLRLESLRASEGSDSIAIARAINQLAGVANAREDLPAVIDLLGQSSEMIERLGAQGTTLHAVVTGSLAYALLEAGRTAESEVMTRSAFAAYRAAGGDNPRELLRFRANLATLGIERRDDPDETEHELRAILDERRSLLGDGHHLVAESRLELGRFLYRVRGLTAEAEAEYRVALATMDALPGGTGMLTRLHSLHNLGVLFSETGRHADAVEKFEAEAEAARRFRGVNSPQAISADASRGLVLHMMGRRDDARKLLEATLIVAREKVRARPDLLSMTVRNLVLVLHEAGEPKEAAKLLEEVIAATDDARSLPIRERILLLQAQAGCRSLLREFPAALRLHQRARRLLEQHRPYEKERLSDLWHGIGVALLNLERRREAAEAFKKATEMRAEIHGPDEASVAMSRSGWGASLMELGEFESAEPLILRAYRACMRELGPYHSWTRLARIRAINVYEKRKMIDEAIPYRREHTRYVYRHGRPRFWH